jgi:hypothetical protein
MDFRGSELEAGSFVHILSPLDGQSISGTGTVQLYDDNTGMYGVTGAWWDGLMWLTRDELRLIAAPSSRMTRPLGRWDFTLRRVTQYDRWYGNEREFVAGVRRLIGKLV